MSYTERNEKLDELLNEQWPIEIAGVMFDRADIVRECDPIAYRCMVADMGYDEEDEE